MFIEHFKLPQEKLPSSFENKPAAVSTMPFYTFFSLFLPSITEFNTADPELVAWREHAEVGGMRAEFLPPDCVSWVGSKILLICGAAIRRT